MLRRVVNKFKRVVVKARRRLTPIRSVELIRSLDELIVNKNEVLFVHSSLSACGYFAGGPAEVVDAIENFGNTIVLPTHTYCYPPSVKAVGPIYDPAASPSLVGAISDWFWRQPGICRSIHPTHSVAAAGPLASSLCAEHEKTETPCGAGTPYDKMLQLRCGVLMFGCTLNTYTLFHTTEHFARCPYLYYPERVTLQYLDSQRQPQRLFMWRQNMEYARRFAEMDAELATASLLCSRSLRTGRLIYIPDAQAVHNYLMERLASNPGYLLKEHD